MKRGGQIFQAVDKCKGSVVRSVRGMFEGLEGGGCGWISAEQGGSLGQEGGQKRFPSQFPSLGTLSTK